MSSPWNTKWGPRRVRHEPPTLREALAAAQDFTDDRNGQIEVAAALMGVPVAEARAELLRQAPTPRGTRSMLAATRGGTRTVVVERRTAHRERRVAVGAAPSKHAT